MKWIRSKVTKQSKNQTNKIGGVTMSLMNNFKMGLYYDTWLMKQDFKHDAHTGLNSNSVDAHDYKCWESKSYWNKNELKPEL